MGEITCIAATVTFTRIPPVGESLPNTEIFRRLAAWFAFDDPMFKTSDAEMIDECIDLADLAEGACFNDTLVEVSVA